MKKKISQYWNFRPYGLLMSLPIIFKVATVFCFERLLSRIWMLNLGAVGSGIRVQKGVVVRYPGNIELGSKVYLGRNCEISTEFSDSQLIIGDHTHINKGCSIDYSGGLEIGANVTLSEGVMIETHSHGIRPRSAPVKSPLKIGNDVWVGARSIILPSVEVIEDGVVIGAGSIVTKSIGAGQVVAGNPARLIRSSR